MDLPNVIMTLLVGMFLALVTPSILRQRERIWGPGQKARIERAKALAGRPPELVTWAVREALIIIWLVIIAAFAITLSVSFMLIDHIRGIPTNHYAYLVFMVILQVGIFFAYVAARGASQAVQMLDAVLGPEEQDEDDGGDTEQP